jgi:hypothetical protein
MVGRGDEIKSDLFNQPSTSAFIVCAAAKTQTL